VVVPAAVVMVVVPLADDNAPAEHADRNERTDSRQDSLELHDLSPELAAAVVPRWGSPGGSDARDSRMFPVTNIGAWGSPRLISGPLEPWGRGWGASPAPGGCFLILKPSVDGDRRDRTLGGGDDGELNITIGIASDVQTRH